MPELPPPPPPPMSIAAAIVDTIQRHRPVWATPRTLAFGAAALTVGAALFLALAARAGTMGEPPELVLPAVGSEGDPGGAGREANAEASDGTVAVHAAGAFSRPGLYELPSGARVADLVDAAGGPSADALLDALNLAARLNDGERVYLPRTSEQADPLASTPPDNAGSTATIVDLNTATLDQLEALPGVGPSTAQAILDHRREHGRFRTVDELLEVRGIGEAKLAAIRGRVRV